MSKRNIRNKEMIIEQYARNLHDLRRGKAVTYPALTNHLIESMYPDDINYFRRLRTRFANTGGPAIDTLEFRELPESPPIAL